MTRAARARIYRTWRLILAVHAGADPLAPDADERIRRAHAN